MNRQGDSENGSLATQGGATVILIGAALLSALLMCGTATADDQTQGRPSAAAQETEAQTRPAELAPPKSKEPLPRISKFEARRFRHACQEKANERGLKGVEREGFLTRCFFGRRAQRGARRECTKQGIAKGLDKAALHDYVRDCLKELRNH